jgi:hypothetical protein
MWTLDLSGLVAGVPGRAGRTLALSAPRPQPSRGRVHLDLSRAEPGSARVVVCDAAGRKVRELSSRVAVAGTNTIVWDGADDSGRRASPGVYFVRAEQSGAVATRRIVRIE